MVKTRLTDDEKVEFYRKGYFVLRGVVPKELVHAAQERYRSADRGDNLTHEHEFSDLVNRSPLTPIMTELMGPFDPVSGTRHIVRPRGQVPGEHFSWLGYRDKDIPYFGADLHIDGQAVFMAPQEPAQGSPEEIYTRYISTGRKGAIGRCSDNIGLNYSPLFHDPDMTNALGGFTSFLFVCLSDQTVPGSGQTCLLPGGHHVAEQFFRWQYGINGHMGNEGPGWPRLNHEAPNRCGYQHLPEALKQHFVDETSERTPDGKRWPKPDQILMEPGDAAIAMYHIPHSGSRNENGKSARKSPIFALVNKKRHPNHVMVGNSDHPDRTWEGGYLEFEPGDGYDRSKFAMLNMYHEWDGMREVVAHERSREGRSNEVFELNRLGTIPKDQPFHMS
jgi:hypothetical protein